MARSWARTVLGAVLVYSLLCPMLCLAKSAADVSTHSCCPGKNTPKNTNPCRHTASAQVPQRDSIHIPVLTAMPMTGTNPIIPVSVTIPPAPRPLEPPPPKRYVTLRI